MADLWYDGSVDYNWNTLGNWWTDSGFSTPAGALPAAGDDVSINGFLMTYSGTAPSINIFAVNAGGAVGPDFVFNAAYYPGHVSAYSGNIPTWGYYVNGTFAYGIDSNGTGWWPVAQGGYDLFFITGAVTTLPSTGTGFDSTVGGFGYCILGVSTNGDLDYLGNGAWDDGTGTHYYIGGVLTAMDVGGSGFFDGHAYLDGALQPTGWNEYFWYIDDVETTLDSVGSGFRADTSEAYLVGVAQPTGYNNYFFYVENDETALDVTGFGQYGPLWYGEVGVGGYPTVANGLGNGDGTGAATYYIDGDETPLDASGNGVWNSLAYFNAVHQPTGWNTFYYYVEDTQTTLGSAGEGVYSSLTYSAYPTLASGWGPDYLGGGAYAYFLAGVTTALDASGNGVYDGHAYYLGALQPDGWNGYYYYISDAQTTLNATGGGVHDSLTYSAYPTLASGWGPDFVNALVSALRLNMDASPFLDSSTAPRAITTNGGVTLGAPKYGAGSCDFPGGSACLSATMDDMDWESDWTIEFWLNATVNGGNATPIAIGDLQSGVGGIHLSLVGGQIAWSDGVSGFLTLGSVQTGVWTHVAAVRLNNVNYLYQDGVQLGSGAMPFTTVVDLVVTVGSAPNYGFGLVGLLDNVRIVKGQAVYNGNFTPTDFVDYESAYFFSGVATTLNANGSGVYNSHAYYLGALQPDGWNGLFYYINDVETALDSSGFGSDGGLYYTAYPTLAEGWLNFGGSDTWYIAGVPTGLDANGSGLHLGHAYYFGTAQPTGWNDYYYYVNDAQTALDYSGFGEDGGLYYSSYPTLAEGWQDFGLGYDWYIAGVATGLNSGGCGFYDGHAYFLGALQPTGWNGLFFYINDAETTLDASGNGYWNYNAFFNGSYQATGWNNHYYYVNDVQTTLDGYGNGEIQVGQESYNPYPNLTTGYVNGSYYLAGYIAPDLDANGSGFISGVGAYYNGYHQATGYNGIFYYITDIQTTLDWAGAGVYDGLTYSAYPTLAQGYGSDYISAYAYFIDGIATTLDSSGNGVWETRNYVGGVSLGEPGTNKRWLIFTNSDSSYDASITANWNSVSTDWEGGTNTVAGAAPTAVDSCLINDVSPSAGGLTCDHLQVTTNGASYEYAYGILSVSCVTATITGVNRMDITASTSITFTGSGINYGTLSGTTHFYGSSHNDWTTAVVGFTTNYYYGTCSSGATFHETSYNGGQIDAPVGANDSGIAYVAVVSGTATFRDSSYNLGKCTDAVFYESAKNMAGITGTSTQNNPAASGYGINGSAILGLI